MIVDNKVMVCLLTGVVGLVAGSAATYLSLQAPVGPDAQAEPSAPSASQSPSSNQQGPKPFVRSGNYPQFSYAQQGEDLILDSLLWHLGISAEKMTYLDIGAWDPIQSNNTFYFYRLGGHGVLVEPNPAFAKKLTEARPRDKVLNLGVGLDAESAPYYIIGGPGGDQLNTFDKEAADGYSAKTNGKNFIETTLSMPLVNINRIIAENFDGKAPTYVSIDVEGLDFTILQSLDFAKYKPAVFCMETVDFSSRGQRTQLIEFLVSKGYTVRGASFVNSIFVRNDLLAGAPAR